MLVMRAPAAMTAAETMSTNTAPPDLRRMGITKTPNTAPIFPIEAASPTPCPRCATG